MQLGDNVAYVLLERLIRKDGDNELVFVRGVFSSEEKAQAMADSCSRFVFGSKIDHVEFEIEGHEIDAVNL